MNDEEKEKSVISPFLNMFPENLGGAIKATWIYFALALVLFLVAMYLDSMRYKPPVGVTYFWIYGIPIISWIPSVFLLFVGLGFFIHGPAIVKTKW